VYNAHKSYMDSLGGSTYKHSHITGVVNYI